MPRTARARYHLAALLWASASFWILTTPPVPELGRLLLAGAITATIAAAVVERDERMSGTIQLAYWAGTCAGPQQRVPSPRAADRLEDA